MTMIRQKLKLAKPVQQKIWFLLPRISKCSYHSQKFGRCKKRTFHIYETCTLLQGLQYTN